MLAGACIRLEIILFRFTVCGLLTAKIRLLSPAGAGALAELGNTRQRRRFRAVDRTGGSAEEERPERRETGAISP